VELLKTQDSVWTGPLPELTSRLTEWELDAVCSQQSAAVQLGARANLAEVLRVAEERIKIVCAPGPHEPAPAARAGGRGAGSGGCVALTRRPVDRLGDLELGLGRTAQRTFSIRYLVTTPPTRAITP